jgi:folate-binding protein YgfZ
VTIRSCGRAAKATISVAQLQNRGLLRVEGHECCDFVQGLITNDIRHLQQPQQSEQSITRSSLFAFMLNPSGRIIADVLIYQNAPDSLLLECDKELMQSVRGHLTVHRLRKKITIQETNEFKVWSLFPESLISRVKFKDMPPSPASGISASTGSISCPAIVNDTRLPIALYRVISDMDQDWSSLQAAVTDRLQQQDVSFDVTSEEAYRCFRYRIGMSEGCSDHPAGVALPLESNGDLLHGISFFKGCYIGQELTARSYHTGVIRKRLMPVSVEAQPVPDSWTAGLEFRTREGKKLLGKLRSVSGSRGLALLYVDQVKQLDLVLQLEDGSPVRTEIPFWWPRELDNSNNKS